jgi:predicted MFS family arabinose efflux permease
MSSIAERATPYREAWRFPAFRKLLFGQGLSMAGDAVCLAALPVALMHAGRSGEILGAIMGAVGIGTVIGAAAGGVLADRKSPRRILIATDSARGLAQLAGAALIVGRAPWWSLVIVYLAFGAGIGVARPCTQVLLVELLPKQALIAGNSAMNFVDNLVAIIVPATLGIAVILWDPAWGVLMDALSFFAAAVVTTRLPERGWYESDDGFSLREALAGVTVIVDHPELLLGLAATLFVNVLCFPIFLVVAPFAISASFGSAMWGVCLAASGSGACIGSVITVLAAGQRHLTALALSCGLGLCAAMTALGMAQAPWHAVLGAGLVGIVESSWLTGWATVMQTHAPERDLGRVVAVDTIATSGVHPFVYLGGGLAGATVGYAQTLMLTAALCAVATAFIASIAIWRSIGVNRA